MTDRDYYARVIATGHCPDCSYAGFRLGPRRGAAQNIECMNCRSRWNVVTYGWDVKFAERIGKPDDTEK